MDATRREFLVGASAVVAAGSVGIPTGGAPIAAAESTAAPTLMAYVVGTPGEHDGQAIWAANARDAFEQWAHDRGSLDHDGICEYCDNWERNAEGDAVLTRPCSCDEKYYTTRIKAWDGLSDQHLSTGDWIDAGFGSFCERCGNETSSDDAYNREGDAICNDCMTLADWKVVDLERYQELLDEALTAEYGPDLRYPEYW